jgi:hypothetical protein
MQKIIDWLKANRGTALAVAAVISTIVGVFGWQFVVRFAEPDEKPGVVITLPAGAAAQGTAEPATVVEQK